MKTLEEMQMIAFQIIAQVGEAKSMYMEAINLAKQKKFDECKDMFKQADESYAKAHAFHFDVVQIEAAGEQLPFSIMFMHAEDQLLTTEVIKLMALEIVELREMIN